MGTVIQKALEKGLKPLAMLEYLKYKYSKDGLPQWRKSTNKRGITINAFARAIDGNRTTVYDVVKGRRRASAQLQNTIAEALGVEKEVLFNENGMAGQAEDD